jgi:hypothetical protein
MSLRPHRRNLVVRSPYEGPVLRGGSLLSGEIRGPAVTFGRMVDVDGYREP